MNEKQPEDQPSIICPYCKEKLDLDKNIIDFWAQTGVDSLRLPCPKCGSSFIYDCGSKITSSDPASHSISVDFNSSCPTCKNPIIARSWVIINVDERPDLLRLIGRNQLNMVECQNCHRSGVASLPLLIDQGNHGPMLFSPIRHLAKEEVQDELNYILYRIRQSHEIGWLDEKILSGLMIVDREKLSEVLGVDLSAILKELASKAAAADWNRVVPLGKKALAILDPEHDKEIEAFIQLAVGNALLEMHGSPLAETIDEAIDFLQAAVEGYTSCKPNSDEWAWAEMLLGNAYSQRIREEKASNLEKAIYHGEEALKVFTPEKNLQGWSRVQHNLANAYKDRKEGEPERNLDSAATHYKQALEAAKTLKDAELWSDAQNGLANLLCDRGVEFVEEAIERYRQALTVRTREAMPQRWAETVSNLATAYCDLLQYSLFGLRGVDDIEENGKKAIGLLEDVLSFYSIEKDPWLWANVQYNLGRTYFQLFRFSKDRTRLTDAVFHFKEALREFTAELFPQRFSAVQRASGMIHFYGGNWEEAHKGFAAAIEVNEDLLAEAYTETGRRAEVAALPSAYQIDAYCLLRLNRPEDAFVRLEQGRARLLAEHLAMDGLDLAVLPESQAKEINLVRQTVRELTELSMLRGSKSPEENLEIAAALKETRLRLRNLIKAARDYNSGFMPAGLDLPGLLGVIPASGALVSTLITPLGSAVFVIPHGATGITVEDHVILINEFTDSDFHSLIFGTADWSRILAGNASPKELGWSTGYHNREKDPEAWLETIQSTGRRLWDGMINSVHQRLAEIGLKPQAPVLFLPEGGLNLLPLHASWREVNGQPRYFGDDYTISYAPSGYALSLSRKWLQQPQRQQGSLLAMVNPTADLPFASIEEELLSSIFSKDNRQILPEKKANLQAFETALPDKSYLHFACHGFYSWLNPMYSGLLFANKTVMTLADVIAHLNLDSCRLAFLSACETGITDISQSPDEYLGLPAGFLQAGAPAVISTLWAVDDISTAILTGEFYRYHIQEELEPAIALNLAQCTLRDSTAADLGLAELYKQIYDKSNRCDINALKWMRYYQANPKIKPFTHPYYWAGFIFSGA